MTESAARARPSGAQTVARIPEVRRPASGAA